MLYFGLDQSYRTGGGNIAEVLRRAWGRLLGKQFLIFYPLALSVINTLAFLAIYAANGNSLRWHLFFPANFDRWQYVQDQFFSGLSFTPALGVAIFVGLATCVFAAMIRAPYFRAIGGRGYPLAPSSWIETARLSLFYLFSNLVVWVLPLAAPVDNLVAQLVTVVALVVGLLIVFADYAIVFDNLAFLPALRRSVRLVGRRWFIVLLIYVVVQLVYFGLFRLYDLYYSAARGVFILLPISQILVESLLVLFVDLVLIYLYEQTRQSDR